MAAHQGGVRSSIPLGNQHTSPTHLKEESAMSQEITYKVGIVHRDITPTKAEFDSKKLYLWGFDSDKRADNSDILDKDGNPLPDNYVTQVHDLLRVTALSIKASNGTVVLVALDIGALSEEMTGQIRAAVQRDHNIPPENVCINVSHAHSAPTVVSLPTWAKGIDTAYAPYVNRVISETIQCVDDSLKSSRDAKLYTGRGTAGIGRTRNNKAAGLDQTLDVIVAKADDKTIATVFSVACHPVLVYGNAVSADYPGVTRGLIEYNHSGIAMFLQGFAGQTDPLGDLQTTGENLYAAVRSVLEGTLTPIVGPLMGRRSMTQLPLTGLPSNWRDIGARDRRMSRWVTAVDQQIMKGTDGTLLTEVQTLRVGEGDSQLRVLASSHEVTCDLGVALRDLLPRTRVTTLAYCNIQCCYLPSKAVLQADPDVRAEWPSGRNAANYEGGDSFIYYVRRGPLTDEAVDQYIGAFRKLVDEPWILQGRAETVTGMAALGDMLYVTTANDILWSRPAAGVNLPWTSLGPAVGIRGLAALGYDLFAATAGGKLLRRPAAGVNEPWTEIGHAEDIAAMTAHEGMLYAATHQNVLWTRDATKQDIGWTMLGPAEKIAGLAWVGDLLLAATTEDGLLWRKSANNWVHFGAAEHIVGMTAIGNRLFAATREGDLWTRDL